MDGIKKANRKFTKICHTNMPVTVLKNSVVILKRNKFALVPVSLIYQSKTGFIKLKISLINQSLSFFGGEG